MSISSRLLLLAVGLPLSLGITTQACNPAPSAEQDVAPIFVSTSWLAQNLDNSSLVLIHIGPRDEYETGHIPNARFLDRELFMPASSDGLRAEIPGVEQLVTVFESMGLTDESQVVLCFGDRSLPDATRAFFTLDYLGLGDHTSLLNGGLQVWMAEGRDLTTDIPIPSLGSFTPNPRPELLVDAEWLNEHLTDPMMTLMDTRSEAAFLGTDQSNNPRAGHIPGAASIPYMNLVDSETMLFLDSNTLRTLLVAKGADPDNRIVTYCWIGRSSTVLHVVARHLGYETVMYDGSFEEWIENENLPVERGEQQDGGCGGCSVEPLNTPG